MITVQELDEVFDQLGDLTREMSDVDRVVEASILLERVETVPRRFLMQWRAAAVADLHYLKGRSIRQLGPDTGHAFQGVSQWLSTYGPTHYLMVRKTGEAPAELKVISLDGQRGKDKIQHYRQAGYQPVPATWNLLEGAELRDPVDPDQLWQRLQERTTIAA